jgi:hypothetical protein
MRNFKLAFTTTVPQCSGGCFNSDRKSSVVGTFPVCREIEVVVALDGDENIPMVSTWFKGNMQLPSGIEFSLMSAYDDLACM